MEDPHDIDVLFETSLRRENNGICRRLAAMSLASKFTHGSDDNIETIDILSTYRYSSDDLFFAARENLDRLSILINSEFFYHSIICIEREYNMKSPLINPFSDLRHNSVEIAGITKGDTRVLNNCRHILEKHCSADLRLYSILNKRFAEQVNKCKLTDAEIQVRNLIHRKPLFSVKWFNNSGQPVDETVIKRLTHAIFERCKQSKEPSQIVYETILKWDGFTDETKETIEKIKTEKFGNSYP